MLRDTRNQLQVDTTINLMQIREEQRKHCPTNNGSATAM